MKLQSKIQFFQAVLKKPELIKKFEQSSNKEYHNNFKLVEEGTHKLLDYIDHLP